MYIPFIPRHEPIIKITFIGDFYHFLSNINHNLNLQQTEIHDIKMNDCNFNFILIENKFSSHIYCSNNMYFIFNENDCCIIYNNMQHFEKCSCQQEEPDICKNIFNKHVSNFVCEISSNKKPYKNISNNTECNLTFSNIFRYIGCSK